MSPRARRQALLLCALAASCARTPEDPPPTRPDILLVTIDTLRADHVGALGHDRDTTPHLDRLASEGAIFEAAYAPVGSTTPSHASLFTGLHPLAHGVTANGMVLEEGSRTLAEALRMRGWHAAAFISSAMASSRYGLARGFAHVDEELEPSAQGPPVSRSPRHVVDAASAWLDARPKGGAPLFLWLHLFDPHSPWEPPPEHAALFPPRGPGPRGAFRAAYEAEVHYSDAQFGRLLAAFDDRPGEGLVIVCSDHGEGLWDHGWPFHSRTTFEEELRVPLILRWRGEIRAGLRLAGPAALRDVPRTVAGLLGFTEPAWREEGVDHSPPLRGQASEAPPRELLLLRPLHPEGRAPPDWKGPGLGLFSEGWKLYWAPEEGALTLFHLPVDPREAHDLADERSALASTLTRKAAELAARESRLARPRATQAPSPEVLEQLRALGYLH